MSVERYDLYFCDGDSGACTASLATDLDGDYVLYEAYQALEARLADEQAKRIEAERRLEACEKTIGQCCDCRFNFAPNPDGTDGPETAITQCAYHERQAAEFKQQALRLDKSVDDAVHAAVELGYDHWLKHGTPIRKQDWPLVAADIKGMVRLSAAVVEKHEHEWKRTGAVLDSLPPLYVERCDCGLYRNVRE